MMKYKSITTISKELGIKYSALKVLLFEAGYLTPRNEHSKKLIASNKALDSQAGINDAFVKHKMVKFTPKFQVDFVKSLMSET